MGEVSETNKKKKLNRHIKKEMLRKNERLLLTASAVIKGKPDTVLAVTEKYWYMYSYNDNLTEKMELIEQHAFDGINEVVVDHYFVKSVFLFKTNTNEFKIIVTEKGKDLESLLKNQLNLKVTVLERKFSRKIVGYRSQSKPKMVVSSFLYGLVVLMFIAVIVVNLQAEDEAAQHVEKAEKLMKEEKYEESLQELNQSIELNGAENNPARELMKKVNKSMAEEHYKNALSLVNQNKIDEAIKEINQSKTLHDDQKENKAYALEKEINKSKSTKRAKETLVKMTDKEFELLQANKLEKSYMDNETLNQKFIKLLVKNKGEREKHLAAERKSLIEKQFSSWDGSHKNVTKYIKSQMNDEDSYEHVETVYWDMKDHLVVRTTFRGNNAFGAKVKNSVKAKVSLEGEITEIIE
ncbi:hypothetical protein F7984_03545 [Pradoshia sp. D12]|uniref:hypothetical protein n=1 Tax=Pradoshia sp. D12 TaxID=2651284 RepID=UPI00124C4790|nr:hypothetical protein [Pradoshia sp. D12]QFK70380.1 hypothetical protein F7984_03545 [Pradoshia sp. D12]